jgi:hypothetical protein
MIQAAGNRQRYQQLAFNLIGQPDLKLTILVGSGAQPNSAC